MTTKTKKSSSSSGSTKSTTEKSTKSTTKKSSKSAQATLAAPPAEPSPEPASPGTRKSVATSVSAPANESAPTSAGALPQQARTGTAGFVRVATRTHRLSIAGRVIDARTRKAVAGAEIVLTDGPEAWRSWLAASQRTSSAQRPELTRSSADGTFRFVDLPDGSYTLAARLPGSGTRYGTVSLQLEASSQRSPFPLATLALPPTAIEGVISGADEADGSAPVAMARVRVMGSGESALTDAEGRFLLHGIETGTRTLQVSARGFSPAQLSAGLEQGGVKRLDVLLERPLPSGGTTP
ncbi:carboxypeptidase regulatory-like domain-containing protein [Hyalangium gracile]|uniref:carboxypeptidase regulatory-like domain-containing protein n=1 Tax=Hyalangium gracile TaxID=394092 RepID=UPI001CCF642A|nr:carboxypeptidase regulatory-like domain-containing protein [Hyalangium gracile]